MKRVAFTKKLRFEVFKRDSFTCQYCGKSAPDVVLHVDHINPVAKGGTNEITNLISSCVDCNIGKGATTLSDNTVVSKQKKQLDLLQQRKDQIEMMLKWHTDLKNLESDLIDRVVDYCETHHSVYFHFTEIGKKRMSKAIKKHGISRVLEAIDDAYEKTIREHNTNKIDTIDHTEFFISTIYKCCEYRKLNEENPEKAKILYITGILRNRFTYVNKYQCIELMESGVSWGLSIDYITSVAKTCRSMTQFKNILHSDINELQQ